MESRSQKIGVSSQKRKRRKVANRSKRSKSKRIESLKVIHQGKPYKVVVKLRINPIRSRKTVISRKEKRK